MHEGSLATARPSPPVAAGGSWCGRGRGTIQDPQGMAEGREEAAQSEAPGGGQPGVGGTCGEAEPVCL